MDKLGLSPAAPTKERTLWRFCRRQALAILRGAMPLSARMRLMVWARRRGLAACRYIPSTELFRDFASTDPNGFHRYLWSNHLAYAESYEESRFGSGKLEASRRILFDCIQENLSSRGIQPVSQVRSVLDVGCSLGYVLRHAETQVFPAAECLQGIDVDQYAVEKGSAHLQKLGSKIQLGVGDISEMERFWSDCPNNYANSISARDKYDVVLCCGVLLYFDEATATRIVECLLRHTRLLLCIIGLSHPAIDNAELRCTDVRPVDGAFIHNVDRMIRAEGRVVFRRWLPNPLQEGSSPPYLILAEPSSPA